MGWKKSGEINLDYEDLIKELTKCERKAESLQNQIHLWMDDAGPVTRKNSDNLAD
jgi:hypothetical protein|tara:strand:- start:1304 stop:1468 length:165 start_codon:yes stop_codon:yes gene_type:complete